MNYVKLGASLYVPATRQDLIAIGNREKYPFLRSVIFCTEDSVREEDVPTALLHLDHALRHFEPCGMLRFIRVRHPQVLRTVLQMDEVRRIDGFVLPKVTADNIANYFALLPPDDPYAVMITLETREVFDPSAMHALRNLLVQDGYKRRILSLRIGGNDLLNLLALRRTRERTIYDTPVGLTISHLVTNFRPWGFNLTAPVHEHLDNDAALSCEVQLDLAHGLFGKTAIHPQQVPLIERHYRVCPQDLEMAQQILHADTAAVFRMHDTMCEPATHAQWARHILERAELYGVHE